jgi:hypothetical protein
MSAKPAAGLAHGRRTQEGLGALPVRPLLSTPAPPRPAFVDSGQRRLARQPWLGLAGLLLVVPVAVLLAVGADGAEPSVLVLGPLVTFGLPAVAMIAFWWEDWPGSALRPGWSGLTDTLLVVAAAIGLTVAGQAVVGRADLAAVFDPTPGPGHPATFPATLPLAGAAFVAMLQLTLVSEGWPLRLLGRYLSGLVAVAAAWVIALGLNLLVDVHPPRGAGLHAHNGVVSAGQFGAVLVLIGTWQVWIFVLWRGWPLAEVDKRLVRLVSANAIVIGGGWLTYVVLRELAGLAPGTISAAAGSFIGVGLVVGMLFEGALRLRLSAGRERLAMLAAALLLGEVLYAGLAWYAGSLRWMRATGDEWITHVGLNAIGVAVILHVAIGRRWPWTYAPKTG